MEVINEKTSPMNPMMTDRDPSWSPDAKRIAFTSGRKMETLQIYVMDADGGNPQNLSNNRFMMNGIAFMVAGW